MGTRNNPHKKTRKFESEKRAQRKRAKLAAAAAALGPRKTSSVVVAKRARRDRILAKNFANDLVKKGLREPDATMVDVGAEEEACMVLTRRTTADAKKVSKKRLRLERLRREAEDDLAGLTVVEDGMGTVLGGPSS